MDVSSTLGLASANVARMDHTERLVAYLQARIEEWLDAEPGRTATQLAAAAKITSAQISDVRAGKRGVGIKTLLGLAVAFKTTTSALEQEAARYTPDSPLPERLPAEPHVEDDDRYFNRGLAVQEARRLKISEEAIKKAEDPDYSSHINRSPFEWLERIRKVERELKRAAKGPMPKDVLYTPEDSETPKHGWAAEEERRKREAAEKTKKK